MAGRQLRFGYFFFWSPLTQTIKFVVWIAQTSPPNRPKRVFEQHRQEIERIAAEKILAGLQGDGPVLVRVVDLSP